MTSHRVPGLLPPATHARQDATLPRPGEPPTSLWPRVRARGRWLSLLLVLPIYVPFIEWWWSR